MYRGLETPFLEDVIYRARYHSLSRLKDAYGYSKLTLRQLEFFTSFILEYTKCELAFPLLTISAIKYIHSRVKLTILRTVWLHMGLGLVTPASKMVNKPVMKTNTWPTFSLRMTERIKDMDLQSGAAG